ncbi:hypothetical protein ACN9MB_14640 [Dyella kyungheensis]|uniref:hypothetical protein n=1 Tax=Dyella kyungheensis TaxID=1242174 RepID=UPI003CE714B2
MALTRLQLAEELRSLDAELLSLEAKGAPQEAIQLVFERMVGASTRTVGPRDRMWWWSQLYSAMDRQAIRARHSAVASLTGHPMVAGQGGHCL